MRQKHKLRTWIGALAAYAFAVQMLLTAAVATRMAVATTSDSFAICHTVSDDASTQPQSPGNPTHAVHHPCIICSFAAAGALPASQATIAFARIDTVAVVWHARWTPVFLGKQRTPQIPQGPPQLA